MNSVIVYGSRHGNTRTIAGSIASVIGREGSVRILSAEAATGIAWSEVDLVVVGGPTEAHGITPALEAFFAALPAGALSGKAAAAFDTRLHWPRWLSGSAANAIGLRLTEAGANIIAAEASFLVAGSPPVNEPGETERASTWALALISALTSQSVLALTASK